MKIEVCLYDESIWLTQKKIADLFNVGIPAINKHLRNIFESGELREDSVVSILEITADDGKNYKTKFYNLDAIIAIGYRVNSKQATHFRIWATQILKEYVIKGFAMNDERLQKNYLDEKELDQLNRIVTMYLDYAESQAQNKKVMYMKDWVEKLDAFLKFNERDILQNVGKVAHEVAVGLAEEEYEKFRGIQDEQFESDFDREVKKLLKQSKKKSF